jgi:hypothetical protein
MKKVLDIILTFTGLIVFVRLYDGLVPLVKMLFCDHVYQTWDMRFDASDSEKMKRFHGDTFKNAFRKCVKCDKQAEALSMIPGQFGWKKTYRELPEDQTVIDVEIFGFGEEETKRQKRDRLIGDILK